MNRGKCNPCLQYHRFYPNLTPVCLGLHFPENSRRLFAEFLSGASTRNAAWFSINKLDHEIYSMSDLFEIEIDVWESMLSMMGMGSINKKGKFWFKEKEFASFLSLYNLNEHCEMNKTKPTGFNNAKWFLRIG